MTANSADADGGGIWKISGDLNLDDAQIDMNTSGSKGAGIWNWGSVTIQGGTLAGVRVEIADLSGNRLGEAVPGLIRLDDDAAGVGWFVDLTPGTDEEFELGSLAGVTPQAQGGVDLLSVLLHELGHQLGMSDLDGGIAPADECAARAWSWSPGNSGRDFAEETTGPRKFLGNPICPFAHAPNRLRRDCGHQTIGVAAWPLVCKKQRLPRKVFRSSITWLSDWLSTLRSADYSNPTQDSLPAAGHALPDGLSTRRIPMKGFRFASYISSPFPKLLAAIGAVVQIELLLHRRLTMDDLTLFFQDIISRRLDSRVSGILSCF